MELVQDCFLNKKALALCLKAWVQKELIPELIKSGILTSIPSKYNRAYYPINADIRVMIAKAITKERNSLFDQDAVLSLLKEYEAKGKVKYFLRQYNTGNKNKILDIINLLLFTFCRHHDESQIEEQKSQRDKLPYQ